MDIACLQDPPSQVHLQKKGVVAVFKMTIYQLDRALSAFGWQVSPVTEEEKIKNLVPDKYNEFLPLLKKAVAEALMYSTGIRRTSGMPVFNC